MSTEEEPEIAKSGLMHEFSRLAVPWVTNAKSGCAWLILTFFAMWLLASPAGADEDRISGRTALLEIAPTSDFLPTVAYLDNSELECSSADSYTTFQSYAQGLSRIASTDEESVTGLMRIEANLDCRTTKQEQIVDVLMIYNVLPSGHPFDTRSIARVRLESGAECYVDAGALEF